MGDEHREGRGHQEGAVGCRAVLGVAAPAEADRTEQSCRRAWCMHARAVDQHVEKGNDDGLYISSVACCHELWALIMDAGTGFTAQARLPCWAVGKFDP